MDKNIEQVCENIKNFIAQDNIKQALEELNNLTGLLQNEIISDEITILAGKHKRLVKGIISGILTYEQQEISLNLLRTTILGLVYAIEKNDITDVALLSVFQKSYQQISDSGITQLHMGSGDIIGGNKNIINVPLKFLFPLFLLGLVSFFYYKNQNKIKHFFGRDKIFSSKDSQFKVLIVPFKVMCSDSKDKDIGLHIKERLVQLNIKDTLNIYPYYLDIGISKNFNGDSAKYLQQYHNADQIIYGSYNDNECSEIDGNEICYNWITDERWTFDSLQNNTFSNTFQVAMIQDLREGKIQGKTDYIIYWLAGLNAYNQILYSKALKHWSYLYESLNFSNYSLANKLGQVHLKLGDYQNAFKFFNKSLFLSQSQQDSSSAIYNLANVHWRLGKLDEAIENLQKTLSIQLSKLDSLHPNLARTYTGIGVVHMEMEKPKVALNFFQKALKIQEKDSDLLSPELAHTYVGKSAVYLKLGKFKEALESSQKALKIQKLVLNPLHPDLSVSYLNKGSAYHGLARYEESLEFYFKALEIQKTVSDTLHPDLTRIYLNIGEVYSQLDKYKEALEFQKKALKIREAVDSLHPNLHYNYINISDTYLKLDKFKEGLESSQKALKILEAVDSLHPNLVIIHLNIGQIYRKQCKLKEALAQTQQAKNILLTSKRSNKIFMGYCELEFAECYSEMGQYISATDYINKSLNILSKNLPQRNKELQRAKKLKKEIDENLSLTHSKK